jgi:hypothetical protein
MDGVRPVLALQLVTGRAGAFSEIGALCLRRCRLGVCGGANEGPRRTRIGAAGGTRPRVALGRSQIGADAFGERIAIRWRAENRV